MVELLLALPVVLLLGLGVVQYSLVYQAKHALDHALMQAARQGAVDHASSESLRAGLAAGLVPYLYGAADWAALLQAEVRAAGHVEEGIAAGWIRLVQRSPAQESFDDWAEPAMDAMGEKIAGTVEIANDNLDNRRLRTQPVSGVAGLHVSEPIGRLSGQTLADANLLRLELVYGVRLVVPVVASLIIRTLSVWNGCVDAGAVPSSGNSSQRASVTPSNGADRLGLLSLGQPKAGATGQPWMCEFFTARDGEGHLDPRIPLRASATVRMMSTARRSDLTRARATPFLQGSSSGSAGSEPGEPPAAPTGPVIGTEQGRVGAGRDGGRSISGSGSSAPAGPTSSPPGLDNGFLGIGSDRPYGMPVAHPAVCS